MQFHEVGAAELSLGEQVLRMYFYTQFSQDGATACGWEPFRSVLEKSWKAFFGLQRLRPTLSQVSCPHLPSSSEAYPGYSRYGSELDESLEDLESLCIVRDLASLTPEEISLMSALLEDHLQDCIAADFDPPDESELEEQRERLSSSLQRLKSQRKPLTMRAVRDDHRILIYSEAEKSRSSAGRA